MAGGSFFRELRKRKVVQAAAIYGAIAWGVTEVVVTVTEQLFLPQWVSTLAVIFFVVGFPIAMFLAWTFDFTARGIRRTSITSRKGTASIAASLVLLVAGTTGLFFLIKPSLQVREEGRTVVIDAAPNSIAILPFDAAGTRPDDAYLVHGLSDELRDQLARVSGLRIAARSSSLAAVEQGMDALTASATLGVASLIEGSVRSQGGVLKISVQLIEGGTGLAIWSSTYERGPRELLGVQQAIAEAVVAEILPETDVMVAEPATRDPTANDLLLLARHYEQKVRERQETDESTLIEAIRLYREATEADPSSAIAHSRLAGALLYLGDLEAAEAPIFRALAIDPNLSEVQNTLGEFHWARGLTGEAGVAWARAVELNPNNPEALQNYARWRWNHDESKDAGEYRWSPGESERVAEMFRRAVQLDPLSLERYAAMGTFLATENHYDDARRVVGRIEELFDGAAAYRVIADLLSFLGEVDRSIAWTIRVRDLEPDNPSHVQRLAEFYVDIGDHETALGLDPNGMGILFKMRRYDEMIGPAEFAMIDQPDDLQIRVLLARAYIATGRYEPAVHVLSTTGLPDSVFNGWRTVPEMQGYAALTNALYAMGEVEMARELARFNIDEVGYTRGYWWGLTVGKACDHAILGEDDKARMSLQRAQKGLQVVTDDALRDAPCFERFSDDPDYQATVRYFDELRKTQKDRLPATLAEFGVSL